MTGWTLQAQRPGATVPGSPVGRLRARLRPGTLETSSLGLAGGKLVQMGIGFLFWLIAARVASEADVGAASAVVSAVNLCAQLALLGVGAALITHLPTAARPDRLVGIGMALVMGVAVAVAVAMAGAGRLGLHAMGTVGARPALTVLFVAACAAGTAGVVVDQVAMSGRRGHHVLSRNLVSGVAALAVLGAALASRAVGEGPLVLAWSIGPFALLAVGTAQMARAGLRPNLGPGGAEVRLLFDAAGPNYVLTLAERVPALVIPLIVVQLVSKEANAHWYVVWMLAWGVFVLPVSVGVGLFAEGRNAPAAMAAATWRALRLSVLGSLAMAVVLAAVAYPLLRLVGRGYAEGGTTALRLLLVAAVPMAVTQAYYSSCRARRRLGEATVVAAVTAVAACAAVLAGARTGDLVAVARAWTAVQVIAGAGAALRLARLTSTPIEQASENGMQSLGDLERVSPVSRAGALESPPAPVPAPSAELDWARLLPLRPGMGRLRRILWRSPWPWAALATAATLACVLAARTVDVSAIGDAGLADALPFAYWAGLAVLSLGFVWVVLQDRLPTWLFSLYLGCVALAVPGLSVIVYAAGRNHVGFRHAGIVDNLLRTGWPDRSIDAYFNWPGFFSLSALFTQASGLHSALPLVRWAPLLWYTGYLLALHMMFTAITHDRRVVWLTMWVFVLGNWVNQDYFAPQAYGYLLLLVVLGLLVRFFDPRYGQTGEHSALAALRRLAGDKHVDPVPRTAVYLVVVLASAALVPAHQLTPFALLCSVAGLVITRRCFARTLPVLIAVFISAWMAYVAYPFFSGHLADMLSAVGKVTTMTDANVSERLVGSPGHQVIVHTRLVFVLALWVLAALGYWRRARLLRMEWSLIVMAFSPLVLLPLQPYGGEMLMRVYLYSLPFAAFGVVSLAWPREGQPRHPITTAAIVVCAALVMSATAVVTRYGNDRADLFMPGEIRGVNAMYAASAPGSLLVSGGSNTPWKQQEYEQHSYDEIPQEWRKHPDVDSTVKALLGRFSGRRTPSLVIVTRANVAAAELYGTMPVGQLLAVLSRLRGMPDFAVVESGPDATVLIYTGKLAPPS